MCEALGTVESVVVVAVVVWEAVYAFPLLRPSPPGHVHGAVGVGFPMRVCGEGQGVSQAPSS